MEPKEKVEMKFRTQADVQREQAQQGYDQQVKKALDDIYASYPTLVRCQATEKMIVELIARFIGDTSVVPTLELFRLAHEENPEYFAAHIPNESIENRKAALIDEIIELLATGGKYTNFDLSSERKRISTNQWDVAKLEARKADIIEKQRLNKFSADELRQQLATRRALPAEYTRERIFAMTPHEIKKLIRDWTANVVNDRLFGRS
jgi:hypothetical protein